MFFLPYNTDAPIYHFPLVTITMIVINVAAFVLTVMYPEAAIAYCLDHGNGLHPIQWITSSFMHAGIIHLVGNMLALWTFGLIVEGKIGWWRKATPKRPSRFIGAPPQSSTIGAFRKQTYAK